ncbi:transposase [Desulfococcaceae bacterium HSG7]|nr:transposase [Desulfococcaceae bacterium HSG7]
MGRAWRIEYEGGLYHLLSRRNVRKDIFKDDQDRFAFSDVIGETAENYVADIFVYVLMGNHCHILLRTDESG